MKTFEQKVLRIRFFCEPERCFNNTSVSFYLCFRVATISCVLECFHGNLFLIFNKRVWPRIAWDDQGRAILKTLLNFGSNDFLFERALCFSFVTSFSRFVLSKCLHPSFVFSHRFLWRVMTTDRTCLVSYAEYLFEFGCSSDSCMDQFTISVSEELATQMLRLLPPHRAPPTSRNTTFGIP